MEKQHETYAERWQRLHGYGRWRTARKEHRCDRDWIDAAGKRQRCPNLIGPGQRYYDTMELIEPPWRTHRLCEACANLPAD